MFTILYDGLTTVDDNWARKSRWKHAFRMIYTMQMQANTDSLLNTLYPKQNKHVQLRNKTCAYHFNIVFSELTTGSNIWVRYITFVNMKCMNIHYVVYKYCLLQNTHIFIFISIKILIYKQIIQPQFKSTNQDATRYQSNCKLY